MASHDRFQIVLLPRREVLVSGLTLTEAVAYQRGYQDVPPKGRQQAVIALVHSPMSATSGRLLRRSRRASSGQSLALRQSA